MWVWIRLLAAFLSIHSLPLLAASRESTFLQWWTQELAPWFNQQPDQFFTSRVQSPSPVRLRYKTFVQPSARGNIVIVHGYGERIEKHMEMTHDFYRAGYNVFAMDQRGFGRSTRVNPQGKDSIYVESFQDYVKDLEQFLVDIVSPSGDRPSFLFAHSMGGLISTMLIHDRPDLVRAAILSAPLMSIQTRGIPVPFILFFTDLARKLGFGSSYMLGQSGPRRPEFNEWSATQSLARWQPYADFYSSPAEWHSSLGGTSFHWLNQTLESTLLIKDQAWAASVQTPILLFQADHDTYVSSEGQDAFCGQAPHCLKIFVPGSRHEIYREQDGMRGPYMQSIWQFLDEQLKK